MNTHKQFDRPKRPRWGLKTLFEASLCIGAVAVLITLGVLKKSVWVELEILTALISGIVFAFFSVVLYKGVRFQNDRYTPNWFPVEFSDVGDVVSGAGFEPDFLDIGDDPISSILGLIVGFLLFLLLALLIVLVFWIGLNIVISTVIAIFLMLFFVFQRSLRYVVVKGKTCRGDLGRTLVFSLRATAGWTLWMYALLLVVKHALRVF